MNRDKITLNLKLLLRSKNMKKFEIDSCEIETDIDELTFNDAEEILKELNSQEMFPVVKLKISWNSDGYLDCDYDVRPPKFERIRRITGYLVGTMDRWNNAKRAEESERVKHGVS